MSSCACRRWGPGTSCEKPIDTPSARELDAKMKALMVEREKQANFWVGGCSATNNDENVSKYAQEDRQCDINQRSNNLSNAPVPTTNHYITLSNSASQQIRFWN